MIEHECQKDDSCFTIRCIREQGHAISNRLSLHGHFCPRSFSANCHGRFSVLLIKLIVPQIDLLRQNIDILSAEYYTKLREKFPALSKTEIKLCSFIKLDLSIAQIAHLQHIDSTSVVVGRYRLKKKLGLGPDLGLDTFLQSL